MESEIPKRHLFKIFSIPTTGRQAIPWLVICLTHGDLIFFNPYHNKYAGTCNTCYLIRGF